MAEVVSSAELFNNAPNSNLPPFDVVVPKGVDPEAMAKDIVGGKIDVSNLNTLVSSKELFGDETPTIKTVSSADLFKDEKPVTPKVTPKREKTLTDKVIGFAQKYLGDQTSAETGSGEATKGFVQGLSSVASGSASWIPAGLSMTPITIDGKGVKLRSPQEMADTARAIQESLTYTPKDKSAREFAEELATPITYVIEKGKDSGDYYKKLGDEAEARGEHKTAKLLWALGGATEVGGEALPFIAPVAVGKGLKAIKGAVKAPEIDLGKVSEKPTSITPDVSAELKASLAKKEVKAPEVKAEEPIAGVEKVEPKPTSQVEKPIEPAKNEGKPAKAALDINKDLIEKGFEGLPERELARYNTIQKAEEVGKAQALVSNPDFFEMAKGNKPIPEDVHPQVLFNVAINEATKAGNIDMLMDLAKSPIAEQRSLAAQQLGASAWEKPTNNIVKTINEVKKARETKVTNPKIKEKIKTVLNEEVKKINLSKEELSWDRFLSKIEC